MTSDQPHWEKISAYLSDDLSIAEKNAVEQWIAASKENETVFREAKKIWENSGMKLQLEDDGDDQWKELKLAMEKERSFSFSGMWMKIAAGVVLLVGLTYVFKKVTQPDEILIAATDGVTTFYLPDSTRVWLNANSSFSYAENYADGNRNTRLVGEAYFQVKRDTIHPFQIKIREATVQVMGTSFNLKEDDDVVSVIVADGVVKFTIQGSRDESSELVKQNEMATIQNFKMRKSTYTEKSFASWRKLNNASYQQEKEKPLSYLKVNYAWHKSPIKRSVIEGTLVNTASLADYRNVLLKISYTKANRKNGLTYLTISDTVRAGKPFSFEKKLQDVFFKTKHVKVEVESAEAVN
jgi:transmembrane sensor